MFNMNGTPNGAGMNNYMMGAGIGNILGGIGNMAMYQNPADSASPYLNQIPGVMQQYLNPYVQTGQQMLNKLPGQYNQMMQNFPQLQQTLSQMMQNPGQFMNNMGQGFQQSPGFKFQVGQATDAANRAAAAGGMVGSPAEQTQLAGTVNNLANQDYYNWMNHAQNIFGQGLQGNMGMYDRGLQGEEGLNQMGFQGANNLSDAIASALMSQANLAYAGTQNQNQNTGGSLGDIGSGMAAMAPYVLPALGL